MNSTKSTTDVILQMDLPSNTPTNIISMEISYPENGYEPCILSGICQNCIEADPNDCIDEAVTSFLDEAFTHRNVTAYNSHLQYECLMGREFLVQTPNITVPYIHKTCNWQQEWLPDEDIPTCICKYSIFTLTYPTCLTDLLIQTC
jgi:hypothetical protein